MNRRTLEQSKALPLQRADWATVTFGDETLFLVGTGGTPSTGRPDYYGSDIRWLKSGDVRGVYVEEVPQRITQLGVDNSNARVYPVGTVVLAMSGRGRTRGMSAVLKVPSACSQSVAAIVPCSNAVVPEYVHFNLASRYDELRNLTGSMDRSGLNLGIIRQLKLLLPPPPEQRAIAHILRAVQDAIAVRQHEVELERERKATLMQHLFTYGTRSEPTKMTEIGEMPESWRVMELGHILTSLLDHRGKTPKKLGGDFTELGVRVISAMNVSGGNLVLDRNIRYVSLEMYNRWMSDKLHVGDVLLTSEAPLGEAAILCHDATYCLSQRLFALRADPTLLDAYFLYHVLRSEGVQSRLQARASGTTAFGIRQSELIRVLVEMPPLPEQRMIAEVLTASDAMTQALEREVVVLEELFCALLEELMTGRLSALPLIEGATETRAAMREAEALA